MMRRIFSAIVKRLLYPNCYSNAAYIKHLRKNKVMIGNNVIFYVPTSNYVDIRKPYLISIGDYCKITRGVCILAHDYSVSVTRRLFGEFVGGSLPVKIGNNVFIGFNAIVLMGTEIGNNCIVGSNSVVKGKFPDNVVIAGNPARVICTVEEFHKKNKEKWVENAKSCALTIYENT